MMMRASSRGMSNTWEIMRTIIVVRMYLSLRKWNLVRAGIASFLVAFTDVEIGPFSTSPSPELLHH
jgi:hypothetical protein